MSPCGARSCGRAGTSRRRTADQNVRRHTSDRSSSSPGGLLAFMLMIHTSPTPSAPEDPRWTAVAARDRRADGAFVYAVRSTGIYCRPSCPSRRPRRDRVEYFAAGADAVAAGYRACRRCDPEAAAPGPVARKVAAALAQLERAEPGHPTSLATLARDAGCSAAYLQRAFVRVLGRLAARVRRGAEACAVQGRAPQTGGRLRMPPSTPDSDPPAASTSRRRARSG